MARKKTKKTVETAIPSPVAKTYSEAVQKAIARITAKNKGRIPTHFQINIYEWIMEGIGHGIVNAVAGSGKTTTLMDSSEALTFGLTRPLILMVAFNRKIADELNAQNTLSNVTCKTLNGLGMGLIYKYINNKYKPDFNENKTEFIAKSVVNYDQLAPSDSDIFHAIIPAISKLVALFKGYGFGAIRPLPTVEDVTELCDRYNVEIPEDVDINYFYDVLFETYERGLKNLRVIDYNDQLVMPIYWNMQFPTYYRFVFVDESQDLNPIQSEMVKRLTARGGRAIFVGDPFQAIYGFRGADPESMANIAADFNVTTLPLSICWRCPKAVIREAQEIIPHIEAAPNAIDGKVETIKEEKFVDMVGEGDFVLSRTVAPLAGYCMMLIRAGIKATVNGSDIGKGLVALINKVEKKKLAGDIYDQISTYRDSELAKLSKPGNEKKRERLSDRFATLIVLAEGCEKSADVKKKIYEIFSDNVRGVMLSTIHKVKGLQAKRVFVIHPELLPHPMAKKDWEYKQEMNLKYVAITRAEEELYWVTPDNPIIFGKKFNKRRSA